MSCIGWKNQLNAQCKITIEYTLFAKVIKLREYLMWHSLKKFNFSFLFLKSNLSLFQAAGYSDYLQYQSGFWNESTKLIGWAGFNRDGKKMYSDAVVLQEKLTLWKNLSDAVDIQYFLKDGDWELKIDIQDIDALVKGYTPYINML